MSQENGMEVDAIIGDTVYSGKENLKIANEQNIKVIARLNPFITQGFRKDQDQFVCLAGHLAYAEHGAEPKYR